MAQTTESMTSAQKQIESHLKAIAHIRDNQFTQDLIDILQNKKHTAEELAVACKAFYDNFLKTHRESFLAKAREERSRLKKEKREQEAKATQ